VAKAGSQRKSKQSDPVADRKERAILALLAEHRGESLSSGQKSDLAWYRKAEAEEIVETVLADLPKKLYCKLSGRQVKVINEQAERYGLPIGDATVDMFAAVAAFHDFLADNARTFGEDEDLRAEKIRKEIAVLERRAKILDGEIKQQKSLYIEKSDLHRRLTWLASKLQSLGERLGKLGGAECQNTVNEFLEELAEELESGHLAV
jgi:ABC-type phosphate transport system auxiliary subunit